MRDVAGYGQRFALLMSTFSPDGAFQRCGVASCAPFLIREAEFCTAAGCCEIYFEAEGYARTLERGAA